MKIAVWIDRNFSPKVGGSFSYVDRLLKAIDTYAFSNEIEVCFATTYSVKVEELNREIIRLKTPHEVFFSKIPFLPLMLSKAIQRIPRRFFSNSFNKQLKRAGVSIIYYPNQFAHPVQGFPFIATHWDIAHRSTYAFPEFSVVLHNNREEFYNNFLPKALMVFVESEAGREELHKYTFLNDERIKTVHLFAGECATFNTGQERQAQILSKLGLSRFKYFFYPAQFLPEKNHYTILKAFSTIAEDYPEYKIIFTGSSNPRCYGTQEYMKKLSSEFGIRDKVVFGGFVSPEEIYVLYKNACAHIMASYVGPTNMPPLEAMEIGCPVICSNLSGHKEEMEDSALYFDAMSYVQLAEAMLEMIRNRDAYLEKVLARSKNCPFTLENALESININFLKASIVRSTWE